MNYAIELLNITKQYKGTNFLANDNVTIKVNKGSVMCLVGENGAGKSTLMNILYGMHEPSSGEIKINGKRCTFHSSSDAMDESIGMVHQHFMLVEELSVLENVILGKEPEKGIYIDYKKAKDDIEALMKVNGIDVPLNKKVGKLPVGVQQKVEILKILYRGADILILDEPTAVLTPQETDELFENIRMLSEQGKTIIFITHKLDEVIRVSDYIYVMRRGKLVAGMATEKTDKFKLAEHMVGRKLPALRDRKSIDGNEIFNLNNVEVIERNGLKSLKDINLTINEGEIVGVAGISGNGQVELAEVISGLRNPDAGQINLMGNEITKNTRKECMDQGISYIPADRKKEGLCMEWSIAQNSFSGYHTLPKFIKKIMGVKFIDNENVNSIADDIITQFDVRTTGKDVLVSQLSGGNQQKIVIGRESIVKTPRLLIAAEPTRGVDIGAISFIHDYMLEMRNKNTGILLISSDLDEIFALSDRIIVMCEGEIVCNVKSSNVSKEELGLYMAGAKVQEEDDDGK